MLNLTPAFDLPEDSTAYFAGRAALPEFPIAACLPGLLFLLVLLVLYDRNVCLCSESVLKRTLEDVKDFSQFFVFGLFIRLVRRIVQRVDRKAEKRLELGVAHVHACLLVCLYT